MRSTRFKTILALAVLLTGIGLLAIYSAAGKIYLFKQSLWFAISLLAFYFAYRAEKRILVTIAPVFYILSLLSLLAVIALNSGDVKRWITLGPVSIQPSEFAKVATILFLARMVSLKKRFSFSFSSLFIPTIVILIPFFLILIQPDLGSSLSFLFLFAVILYFKGLAAYEIVLLFSPLFSFAFGLSFISWIVYFSALGIFLFLKARGSQFLLGLVINSLFGLSTPIIFAHLRDYQKARIASFFSSSLDQKGIGWSAFQSKVAIGSGLLFGKGFLKGKMARLEFIPNRHTDFIFTTIGEEFGFFGSLIFLGIFLFFLYHLFALIRLVRDEMRVLIIAGAGGHFLYYIIVNLGMVLGIIPVTGITLPFISYGGSSLLANFIILGILLNFGVRED